MRPAFSKALRSAVSVMRGSAITLRRPAASTRAEHRVVGQLVDHVGRRAGAAGDAEITSSSKSRRRDRTSRRSRGVR